MQQGILLKNPLQSQTQDYLLFKHINKQSCNNLYNDNNHMTAFYYCKIIEKYQCILFHFKYFLLNSKSCISIRKTKTYHYFWPQIVNKIFLFQHNMHLFPPTDRKFLIFPLIFHTVKHTIIFLPFHNVTKSNK